MHNVGSLSRLSAKALTEQFGDVGLIFDDEDADAHAALPLAVLCSGRGS
jgi:hypothetical protein